MTNHPIVGDHNQLIDIKEYSENVYRLSINYGWGANIVVIKSSEGLILIDTGYRATSKELINAIIAISSLPVQYIINTHHHSDHTGGNFICSPQGKIIIHSNARKYIDKPEKFIFVEDNYKLEWGEEEILISTIHGGHSECDMQIFLKKSNIICLGDQFLSGSFPLIGNKIKNSASILLENLKKAIKIGNINTVFIGGHGNDLNYKQFEEYISMVEDTISVVVAHIKKHVPLVEIKELNVLKQWDKYSNLIEFITKNTWISDIYFSYYTKFS